jgi:hypothetical protein
MTEGSILIDQGITSLTIIQYLLLSEQTQQSEPYALICLLQQVSYRSPIIRQQRNLLMVIHAASA